jgi:transposase
MLKRHEVEILLKAGHCKAEVARLTGVSLCSVKRIAQEGPVVHVDDAAERAQRQVGRPSRVANFRKLILEILQQKPDLASLEILRRVREAGYQGGKTALYALVASLRPKSARPLVRFEGLPGEFSQHDFGEIVPYHMIGARSMKSAILGHYADYIRTLHPDAPLPGVYLAERIFDDVGTSELRTPRESLRNKR